MRSSVGSPGTEKGTVATPADWRALRRGVARPGEAPVTRRARRPMDAAAAGTWPRVPSPKRMRVAVANSKVGMVVRGIGADSKGQGQDDGGGESGAFAQGAQGVAQILAEALHRC